MLASLVEFALPHLAPFMAALSRIAGLFLFAPAFGGSAAPMQARALTMIALSLVVYPAASAHVGVEMTRLDLLALAPMLAGELLVGLSIGLIASLPIINVQAAGEIMSHKMGLRLGDTFNPAIDLGGDAIGQLLFYVALVAFLSMGGAEAMVAAVADSFARIPVGAARLDMAPLDLIVALASSGLELAMRVSAPVITILFLEMIAAGMIMKTMPQLNILSFGFAVKILVGLLALAGALAAIQMVIRADVGAALDSMARWAGAASPGA